MTEQSPTFNEILTLLKSEESEPSYAGLNRWQERYPQFRDELEDYFAYWADAFFENLQFNKPDAQPNWNEQWLTDFGAAYAMQITRRQQAGIPDDRIESLSDFEQLVLTAMKVQRTPRWQYLDRITDTVRERSNHHYLRSSVRDTLKMLEERYLVFSWSPDPDKHPDEAGKTYFFLSSLGEASLKKAKKASRKS